MFFSAKVIFFTLCILFLHEQCNASNPRFQAMQHFLLRNKRSPPTGSIYDPPLPVFPSRENAPFWNPAPYPLPVGTPPPPSPRRKIINYDPNNPYLDILTEGYYPNYGLGFAYQAPTQIGGGINWPTGNVLQPSDHFNGTFGFATPRQLRIGTQLGPFYPWQNPKFIKTVKDLNDANALSQFADMQAAARKQDQEEAQLEKSFIPVQPQFDSPVPAVRPQPQPQQQFLAQPQWQRQQQRYFSNGQRQTPFGTLPN